MKQEEQEGQYVSLADVSSDAVATCVSTAVEDSMTRLFSESRVLTGARHTKCFLIDLAEFEKGKSQVSLLIGAASNLDNLCRMDPVWNPWF